MKGCIELTLIGGVSRQVCATQCLDIVLELHKNRLLGRLGSTRYTQASRFKAYDPTPIGARLDAMIDSTYRNNSKETRAARIALLAQVRKLRKAITGLEEASVIGPEDLRAVVVSAAGMLDGTQSLRDKLAQAGFPPDFVQRKEVRQIKAIGNYPRICNFLAHAARSHRALFGSMDLEVPFYRPEYWPVDSKNKHFVHAEIQLLVHHEVGPGLKRPRCIGVSKMHCFLCYHFLLAHDRYRVLESHGEVHTQWTVPESGSYSKEGLECLRAALRATVGAVGAALRRVESRKCRRLAPRLQSAVNSVVGSLRSASASTLRPAPDADQIEPTIVHQVCDVFQARSEEVAPLSMADVVLTNDTLTDKVGELVESDDPDDSYGCQVTCGKPATINLEWLEVHLSLEQDSVVSLGTVKSTEGQSKLDGSRAPVGAGQMTAVAETASCIGPNIIDVSKLSLTRDLVLEKHPTAEKFDVVLQNSRNQHIRLSFTWSKR